MGLPAGWWSSGKQVLRWAAQRRSNMEGLPRGSHWAHLLPLLLTRDWFPGLLLLAGPSWPGNGVHLPASKVTVFWKGSSEQQGISYKYTWWLPNFSQPYNPVSIYFEKWRLVASYTLQSEFVLLAFEISFTMRRVTPNTYVLLFLVISKDLLKKHAIQTPKSQSLWPASAWDNKRFGPNIVLVFKVVHIL